MHQSLKLKNYQTGQATCDQLHASERLVQNNCSAKRCLGSLMGMPGYAEETRPREDVERMAKDFFNDYFTSQNSLGSPAHAARWAEVQEEVSSTGTYDLSEEELTFGAKLSWRNASRCIGRIQWNKLKLFDARHLKTTQEMFNAICTHVKYGTNNGNIRSTITVFRQRRHGQPDFRVWNSQLISYAGYKMDDGTIIGDPINVEFTKVCKKLGWVSKGTQWDILPMVLSNGSENPDIFDLPPEIVLQVPLTHPTFEWFAELGLRWYAMPAVSGMLFDVGGVQFPAAPFSGWYMATEIGCRDLCDPQRYNILELVAAEMGEDTSSPATLWKDRALVEVNVAVLHSFQQKTITIVDHHTASDNFVKHLDNEQKSRKGCPADWVWIVPPMSGSLTSVYHQEMALYSLKPSYEYQEPAWRTHDWREEKGKGPRFTFKQIARVVQACTRMFTSALRRRVKVTILFATETGKSEGYANKLADIFSHGLSPKVICMADYDVNDLQDETVVIVVTSTFGNGDGPENGEEFANKLSALASKEVPGLQPKKEKENMKTNGASKNGYSNHAFENTEKNHLNGRGSKENTLELNNLNTISTGSLNKVRFAVFALGSSVYPNFCAFGHHIDNLLNRLGGHRLMEVEEGDEMSGQEKAFRKWFSTLFPVVCKTFNLAVDMGALEKELSSTEVTLTSETVRFVQGRGELLDAALSKFIKKRVLPSKLLRKTFLHSTEENGSTILLEISSDEVYQPGDHVGVFPENRRELVEGVMSRLDYVINPNLPVKLQVRSDRKTSNGLITWVPYSSLPTCSLYTLLSRFLDITTPLQPTQLEQLAACTEDFEQKDILLQLATDSTKYETWRNWRCPHLLEVLDQFPSVKLTAPLLVTILHPLQPRFYSISSSPEAHQAQIHITVAVVTYKTRGGNGPAHYGVCSNYLSNASPGDSIYMFVRKGHNFALPSDMSTPVIMVGPGTGIAPFRGFWQHRMAEIQNRKNGNIKEFGSMWLFFGCRTKAMDLFRDEKAEAVKQGVIEKTFLALSREPGTPKTYVQELLQKEGEAVYRKLKEEGGHLYVCGDVTMADGVTRMLLTIAQQFGHLDEVGADRFMKQLKVEKRLHEDIFGATVHVKTPLQPKISVANSIWSAREVFVNSFLCCSVGKPSRKQSETISETYKRIM